MTAGKSAADYAGAGLALLPRGRVWPGTPSSVQGQLMEGLGRSCADLDAAARALLDQTLPTHAEQLLPEWEALLELAAVEVAIRPTIAQRQGLVGIGFVGNGGASATWFIDYAAAFGFEVTIKLFGPFRTGHSRCGDALGDESSIFVWRIDLVSDAANLDQASFRTGTGRCGDPLSTAAAWRALLKARLTAMAPAHTVLLFGF